MTFRKSVRSPALALVVAIPLLSVIAGAAMLYLAYSDDASVVIAQPPLEQRSPLSKTSWRGEPQP